MPLTLSAAQVLPFATYCAAVQRDVHTIMGMCEGAAVDSPSANVPVVAGLNSEAEQPEGPAAPPVAALSSRVSAPAALERASLGLRATPDPAPQLQRAGLPPGLPQPPCIGPKAQIQSTTSSIAHVDSSTCLLPSSSSAS